MDPEERKILIKKLRYQTWHRGCKETDILLGHFCDKFIEEFDDEELQQLIQICDIDDWDLYSWLTRKAPVPDEYNNKIMQKLMQFNIKIDG
ncbi:MAG: succinate dehydrogenase assembly factor 2 [Pseudomonadota bacterium]